MPSGLGTAAAALTLLAAVTAHDLSITDTLALFKSDGSFLVDLTADLDELSLGLPKGQDSRALYDHLASLPADEQRRLADGLRQMLQRRVRLIFDGRATAFSVEFPDALFRRDSLPGAAAVAEGSPSDPESASAPADGSTVTRPAEPTAAAPRGPAFFGLTARLNGHVPAGARQFSFRASRAFPAVRLTILHQGRDDVMRFVLGTDEESSPYDLPDANGAAPSGDRAAGAPGGAAGEDAWCVAGRYLKLGFEHILPLGLDHILFVLGLFLLSTGWRPLLWQVTAFTLAHSISLGLSMYGVVSLPSRLVETSIAASIVYVGVENSLTPRLHAWRPAMVFLFGLLHGLGFAGVLSELGLPRGEFAPALAGFNVGVELGQLAVIGMALLAVGRWRRRPWYRARVIVPASLAIAAVAAFWTVQRALG